MRADRRVRPANVLSAVKMNENFVPHSLPPEPTTALPGSKEKIEILSHRILCGYHLWHPDDRDHNPRSWLTIAFEEVEHDLKVSFQTTQENDEWDEPQP